MTPLPDWILDGFERSAVPAFVTFARDARAGQLSALPVSPAPAEPERPGSASPHTTEADPVETLMALYQDLYTVHDALNATALLLDNEVPALSAHVPQVMGLDQDADQVRLDLAFALPGVTAELVTTYQRQLVALTLLLAQGNAFTLGSTPSDVRAHWTSGLLHLTLRYPGTVPLAQERADLLRHAAAVIQLRGVVQDLRELLSMPATSPAQTGTLEPDELLSAAFLQEAGLMPVPGSHGDFTWVAWTRGAERRVQGLMWLKPAGDRPYPVLSVLTDTEVAPDELPDLLTSAFRDHFMQLTVPAGLATEADHNWIAARTLTPAVFVRTGPENTGVGLLQPWPVFGPVTPALLRYLTQTAFGQFRDVLDRAGYDVDGDFTPPGGTGPGERDWLTSGQLLHLAGPRWTWEESRSNEIRCLVQANLKGGRSIELAFYLRYVNREEDSFPALYLRAHTNGGLARGALEQVSAYNRQNANRQAHGVEFPLSLDGDGDLTVRQIVLCPQHPAPADVQHLIQVAEHTLLWAAQAVLP